MSNAMGYNTGYDTKKEIAYLSIRLSMQDGSIKELWRENDKLKADNAKLMEMIEAMWYCPGMPGAPETPDHPSFKNE